MLHGIQPSHMWQDIPYPCTLVSARPACELTYKVSPCKPSSDSCPAAYSPHPQDSPLAPSETWILLSLHKAQSHTPYYKYKAMVALYVQFSYQEYAYYSHPA